MKNVEMETKIFTRTQAFLSALDWYVGETAYYDEEKEDIVIDSTEEEAYNYLMATKEFHFLGAEKVKSYIHIAFTDYDSYYNLLKVYNAYAC